MAPIPGVPPPPPASPLPSSSEASAAAAAAARSPLPFSISPLLLRCRRSFHLPAAAAAHALLRLRIRPCRVSTCSNSGATSSSSRGGLWRHGSGPFLGSLATRTGLGYSIATTTAAAAATAAAFGSFSSGNCVGSVAASDSYGRDWLDKLKTLTGGLIIANVLIFIGQVVTKGHLTVLGANTSAIGQGEWWRLISAAFLHGGPFHLLINMYSLYNTAPLIQMLLGTPALVSIYSTSAVTGNLMSYAFTTRQGWATSVGASGAIFGLIGAILAANNHVEHAPGLWPLPGLKESVLQTVILNIIIGLRPGIDNFGHLGGFLGGYLAAWYLVSSMSICESKCFLGPLVWKQKCQGVQRQYKEYQREAKALPSKTNESSDNHAREVLDRKREKLIVEAEAVLSMTPAGFSNTMLKQDLKKLKKRLENSPLL